MSHRSFGLTQSRHFQSLITSFITRKDTLFLEDEIDSSGQKLRMEPTHPSHSFSDLSSKPHLNSVPSFTRSSVGLRNFSSDDEESDSSKNYGTFVGSSPSGKEDEGVHLPVCNNMYYIRLQFVDEHLSDEKDPDAQVIRREDHVMTPSNHDVRKTLRALGETRKKAKDLVVGSTQFLVNTTGKLGTSIISLVNGENRESGSSASSSSLGSQVNSSSALLGKPKRKFEPRHIPIVQEEEDPNVVIPEIRRNMDESD